MQIIYLKRENMTFSPPESQPGSASRCQLLTPDISESIGGTMHRFDRCSIEWTTKYDQALVVVGGSLRIRTGQDFTRTIRADVGDIIWLPKATPLKYEGRNATTFSAVYPANWRSRGEADC